MTLRVGLDISALSSDFKEHALRGIGRYVFELKRYFDREHPEGIDVLPFRHEEFAPPGIIYKMTEMLPYGRQTVRQQILFPFNMTSKTRGRFDVLHFPAHMDAPSWSVRRYVLTVLDLIPVVCADLYKADRPSWRFHLARWLEMRAIQNASHILAISENTARDVHQILKIPRERITVTPLGVDQSFFETGSGFDPREIRSKYSIPLDREIVLYVGGIDPRKNVKGMFTSFRDVVTERREKKKASPVLVMAGKISGDREFPKLLKLRTEFGLEDSVILAGYVPDEDLRRLYSMSALFFFPSLYEGFGLPPLEALAAGVPVVSSCTSAMPEVLGSAAVTYDPADSTEGARAILSILDNVELTERLRRDGPKQARLFTWETTGRKTVEAYRKLSSYAIAA